MNALTINKLYKTYSNGVAAVKGVDLTVEQGDFFALLGPNGAGKTTIIGIISSLVNKTSGKITVNGFDLDTDLIAAKSCMGLVPQELNFNQFEKVIDIVVNQAGFYGISRKLALPRAEKYLQLLGLWDKRFEMSRNLSGGMKRRLMIARALAHEPKILILDEPTANVDIELRRATWDFLKELNRQGTTIILTTHNLEEAEVLCRGIAIIDRGLILENTVVKTFLSQLHRETIILDLDGTVDSNKIPVVKDTEIRLQDSNTLEIDFTKDKSLNKIFAELTEQGVRVRSMRNKSNRLEELFLAKVNKVIAEEENL